MNLPKESSGSYNTGSSQKVLTGDVFQTSKKSLSLIIPESLRPGLVYHIISMINSE